MRRGMIRGHCIISSLHGRIGCSYVHKGAVGLSPTCMPVDDLVRHCKHRAFLSSHSRLPPLNPAHFHLCLLLDVKPTRPPISLFDNARMTQYPLKGVMRHHASLGCSLLVFTHCYYVYCMARIVTTWLATRHGTGMTTPR